jgi:antiviral helicase SKI2
MAEDGGMGLRGLFEAEIERSSPVAWSTAFKKRREAGSLTADALLISRAHAWLEELRQGTDYLSHVDAPLTGASSVETAPSAGEAPASTAEEHNSSEEADGLTLEQVFSTAFDDPGALVLAEEEKGNDNDQQEEEIEETEKTDNAVNEERNVTHEEDNYSNGVGTNQGAGGEHARSEKEELDDEFHSLFDQEQPQQSFPPRYRYAITTSSDDPQALFDDACGHNPAMSFPFRLDAFQLEALARMEQSESVFVAAHTSAGKTVPAEYALSLAKQSCSKALYTSPVKTLSNQKFRDLKDNGFDVGLLTGDTQVNPEASCLVLTTEILRSMLYRGSNIIRDVEWVIFDEVHYVNDTERGVVWEEALILLPRRVKVLMLSATVPNARDFAEWVGRTREQSIRVVQTHKRPVPLKHCVLYGTELIPIAQEGSFFHSKWSYVQKRARSDVSANNTNPSAPEKGSSGGNRWDSLVKSLQSKELTPAIIFVFSKAKADTAASSIRKQRGLIGRSERSEVEAVWRKALARLRTPDRQLPQIQTVKSLCMDGVGVHHAGLLPIVKEVVEMLFCKGAIKALFCTETFALGVNAPAKAVVFSSLRKHDGIGFRQLHPGEYTQMAGRAGRRGQDDEGHVVVGVDSPHEVADIHATDMKKMTSGASSLLSSKFRISFGTVLSVLQTEDLTAEGLMRSSFQEFHQNQADSATRLARIRREKKLHTQLEDLARRERNASPDAYDIASKRLALSQESSHLAETVIGSALEASAAPSTTPGTYGVHGGRASKASSAAAKELTEGRLLQLSLGSSTRPLNTIGALLGVFEHPHYSQSQSKIHSQLQQQQHHHRQHSSSPAPLHVIVALIQNICDNSQLPEPKHPVVARNQSQRNQWNRFANMRTLRSKDDDDDDLMMKVASESSKGKKGGRGSAASTEESSGINTLPDSDHVPRIVGDGQHAIVGAVASEVVGVLDARADISDGRSVVLSTSQHKVQRAVQAFDAALRQREDTKLQRKSLVKALKLNDPSIQERAQKFDELSEELAKLPAPPLGEAKERQFSRLEALRLQQSTRVQQLQQGEQSLESMPEFEAKEAVLRQVGAISERGQVVQVKGRVACELSALGCELLGAEIILRGTLNDLDASETAALLSCFVSSERKLGLPEGLHEERPKLAKALDYVSELAWFIGELQQEHGVKSITPEDYVNSTFLPGLARVVLMWADGYEFATAKEYTEAKEGGIVKCMVRLDEALRGVGGAARVIGDPTLFQKSLEASSRIKRDIAFVPSLWLS